MFYTIETFIDENNNSLL